MKNRKAGLSIAQLKPKPGPAPVFSPGMEADFVKYLVHRANVCYGMTALETRVAAFQFAKANNLNVPEMWINQGRAGLEWYWQFRHRHPELSLRKPEACSLSRATSFNKHKVDTFFDNLEAVLRKYPELADGTRVFNADETALLTVQIPQKVLASKKTRRLNKVTSAERGTLVTACCIIGGNGTYIPPVLVFPRKNMKEVMLKGAPVGTLGLANPSGWMNGDSFLEVMIHFVKYTNSSRSHRTLLILDNHESHLTPAVVNYAKENGVELLTLPPHCSNRLQPLDVAVYRSLKLYYHRAMDTWMLCHPGSTITIYDVAALFNEAFVCAFTPKNILSGFSACGIVPLNRNVFTESDFLCSSVTDRPLAQISTPIASSSETNSSLSVLRGEPASSLSAPSQTTPEQGQAYGTSGRCIRDTQSRTSKTSPYNKSRKIMYRNKHP